LFVPDRVPPVQRSSFLVSRKRHSMSTVYVFIQTFEDKACHPERSEGSGSPDKEILRCAQSLRKTRSEGMTARTLLKSARGKLLSKCLPWRRVCVRLLQRAHVLASEAAARAGRGQAIAPTMDELRQRIQRSRGGAMACPRPAALQQSHAHPLAPLHLTGTKNGVIILITALYTYSQQYCRVKSDTFRKC